MSAEEGKAILAPAGFVPETAIVFENASGVSEVVDLTNRLPIAAPAGAIVGGTITRPADTTAYALGDLIAASTVAATVNASPTSFAAARVNGGTGLIRRVRLSTTKTGLAGTEIFRVHFLKTAPTVANGDNGAFSINGVGAIHIGYADVTLDRVFSDGSKGIGVPAAGTDILFDVGAATTNLYWLLEARGTYQPASGETFTMAAEILRD